MLENTLLKIIEKKNLFKRFIEKYVIIRTL